MPSKKPRIQALVDEKTYEKVKMICQIEERTESYIGGKAIELYVKTYESEHGEIKIDQE